jgi:hypothetical protein
MTTIKDIILEKIEAAGADGLCNTRCPYSLGGCGKEHETIFMACMEEDYNPYDGFYMPNVFKCVLAKEIKILDYCKQEWCADCRMKHSSHCRTYKELTFLGKYDAEPTRYIPLEEGETT